MNLPWVLCRVTTALGGGRGASEVGRGPQYPRPLLWSCCPCLHPPAGRACAGVATRAQVAMVSWQVALGGTREAWPLWPCLNLAMAAWHPASAFPSDAGCGSLASAWAPLGSWALGAEHLSPGLWARLLPSPQSCCSASCPSGGAQRKHRLGPSQVWDLAREFCLPVRVFPVGSRSALQPVSLVSLQSQCLGSGYLQVGWSHRTAERVLALCAAHLGSVLASRMVP